LVFRFLIIGELTTGGMSELKKLYRIIRFCKRAKKLHSFIQGRSGGLPVNFQTQKAE